jgi:hypothetical protein
LFTPKQALVPRLMRQSWFSRTCLRQKRVVAATLWLCVLPKPSRCYSAFLCRPQVLGGSAGAYLGRREALVLLALQLAGRLGLSDQVHVSSNRCTNLCCSEDISRIWAHMIMLSCGSNGRQGNLHHSHALYVRWVAQDHGSRMCTQRT